MTIQQAIDISHTLAFTVEGKHVLFSPQLRLLCEEIVAVHGGEVNMPQRTAALLESYLQRTPGLISEIVWPETQDYYDRFILFGSNNPDITVMALIWPRGTYSPIHYHRAWCVFGVYEGQLQERVYKVENGKSVPSSILHYTAGMIASDGADNVYYYHALGNTEHKTAVSFHVYGVAPEHLQKINVII